MSQARFVHIVDDVPELEGYDDGPVLLVCLDGFLDAGSAAGLAMAQVTADDPGRVVASFEVDEFFDYRARRPPLTFVEDHYTDYEAPRLVVRLNHDEQGAPFLALTGPEPDIRWEAFARGVRAVVEHFGVRLVVALGSVPMAVPHTRPVQVTNHATSQRLLIEENVWRGELRVPSSAVALLEVRLGEWGFDACGFVAHIPHYVAQYPYPDAAVALLERVARVTGLTWQVDELVTAGEAKRAEIGGQVAESEEVRAVVTGLEQQYDAFHGSHDDLLASGDEIPSGEELGAQFEQFLADLDQPEDGE
ncbi:MAG TPA: PAC2 family protein [Marmoricola sp.]|nr:PAC2 family protein [Marmoricola sp.]